MYRKDVIGAMCPKTKTKKNCTLDVRTGKNGRHEGSAEYVQKING